MFGMYGYEGDRTHYTSKENILEHNKQIGCNDCGDLTNTLQGVRVREGLKYLCQKCINKRGWKRRRDNS